MSFIVLSFVVAELLNGDQELVVAFHMLLGCIDFVISSTPSFQLKPPLGKYTANLKYYWGPFH